MTTIVCNLARYVDFPEAIAHDLDSVVRKHDVGNVVLWCSGPENLIAQIQQLGTWSERIVWVSKQALGRREQPLRWAFLRTLGYSLDPPWIDLYGNAVIPEAEILGDRERCDRLVYLIGRALDPNLDLATQLVNINALKVHLDSPVERSKHGSDVVDVLELALTYGRLRALAITASNFVAKAKVIDISDVDNLSTLGNVCSSLDKCRALPPGILRESDTVTLFNAAREAERIPVRTRKGVKVRLLWWAFYFCFLSLHWHRNGNSYLAALLAFRALETWSIRFLFELDLVYFTEAGRLAWKSTRKEVNGGGGLIHRVLDEIEYQGLPGEGMCHDVIALRQFVGYRNRTAIGHGYVTPSSETVEEFYGGIRRLIRNVERHYDLTDSWWLAMETRFSNAKRVPLHDFILQEWRNLFPSLRAAQACC